MQKRIAECKALATNDFKIAISDLDPVFFQLAPQRALVDSQFAGGLSPMPFAFVQGFNDLLGFRLNQEGRRRGEVSVIFDSLGRLEKIRGKVRDVDLRSMAKDEGVLQNILELSNVPGKIVTPEKG
jgi:hypothetical protein